MTFLSLALIHTVWHTSGQLLLLVFLPCDPDPVVGTSCSTHVCAARCLILPRSRGILTACVDVLAGGAAGILVLLTYLFLASNNLA